MDSFDESSKVIKAIGHIRTPFDGKFGIPRQGNMVSSLRGTIVFC